MSKSYPMTDDTLGARLESFKSNVDGSLNRILDCSPVAALKSAANYRRRGGLHFANVAGVNVQWSFKRKPVKVAAPVEAPASEAGNQPQEAIRAARIALAMRRKQES